MRPIEVNMMKSIYEDQHMIGKAEKLIIHIKENQPGIWEEFENAVRNDGPLLDLAHDMMKISVDLGLANSHAAAAPVVSIARYLTRKKLGMSI